jgi:fimbrial chaperone protein
VKDRGAAGSAAALFLLGLLSAGLAGAATFRVSPIQLSLTAKSTSGLLTISNESDETLRFQVAAYRWSQGAAGEMELEPTDDVVLFPRLLTLEAHRERKIRVGAAVAFAGTERTYRVFVEELPSAESVNPVTGKLGVRVLTRMGVPIFLKPSRTQAGGAIVNPTVEEGRLRFEVRNNGNVHLMLEAVNLRGTGEGGETVIEEQVDGWYVLAGGVRQYDLALPREECGRVRTLRIEARTENGTLSDRLELKPGACRPPNG